MAIKSAFADIRAIEIVVVLLLGIVFVLSCVTVDQTRKALGKLRYTQPKTFVKPDNPLRGALPTYQEAVQKLRFGRSATQKGAAPRFSLERDS